MIIMHSEANQELNLLPAYAVPSTDAVLDGARQVFCQTHPPLLNNADRGDLSIGEYPLCAYPRPTRLLSLKPAMLYLDT